MKPETNFGRWKGTTFIVITSNLEFSSTCRRKNHSQDHCDTLTWSGQHARPWTCCKKTEKIILGTLMASRNLSEPWTRVTQFTVLNEKPPDRYMCQPQGLIIRGQELRPECQKQLNERKSSNGQSRYRSSTIRESREE